MNSFALRSWAEVSLNQIVANYQAIQNTVGSGVTVTPVVKADAYHHGAVAVAGALEKAGAARFAVASTDEGAELREAGIGVPIVVMSDTLAGNRPLMADYNLTPGIHSLADLADWNRIAQERDQVLPYHLKFDSGFGRLGTVADAAAIVEAVSAAKNARMEGLMSHFASASDYERTQTEDQMREFNALRQALAAAGIVPRFLHMSSSVPVAYHRQQAWGNLVRPGISLYGYVPASRGPAPTPRLNVAPALSWKAAILVVKDVPAGAPIGYGALFRAPKPMRIAVIGAGYADGIPHRLSTRGSVIAAGRLVPMLGAVSMDVTTIDITDCAPLQPGDAVTLIGAEGNVTQNADDIAQVAGIISYAVLCGITSRVRRIYV